MHFQCRAPTENYKNGISRLSKLRKHLEHMRQRHDRHGTPWQPGAETRNYAVCALPTRRLACSCAAVYREMA
jgi:hypothetical protein